MSRTPDEIAVDIAATRNRLAGTIDQLVYRAQPKTVISRQLASIKASFYDDSGSLNTAQVAKVAGVAVGAVALVAAIRYIVS